MNMRTEDELYPEDLERVKKVTSSGIHSVDRKPFRLWVLLLIILASVSGLSLLSLVVARIVGAV